MNHDDPARIGYRGTAISRAKSFAVKALLVAGGALVMASAFFVSLFFFAIILAVVLTVGGYAWWKTRDLRKQIRERMQAHSPPPGRVIEGEVVSQERPRR